MQLIDIRTEVMNCGFDTTLFSAARVNQYINNGYLNIVRRVAYYVDESTNDYNTVSGTATYALPADFAKVRSVRDTSRQTEMISAGLRSIDGSITASGAPEFYALDGSNIRLYPTPDNVYPIEVRYWKIPAALAVDTDVPTIPSDYHNLLCYFATGECYRAEDDHPTAAQWQALFDKGLAEFAADMKFPNDDMPTQVSSMWDSGRALNPRGWTIYGTDWGW